MKWPVLLLCLIPVGGCAGTLCDAIDYNGHLVERGMSAVEVKMNMVEQDSVNRCLNQLRYVNQFWKLRIGMSRTSEWVWMHVDPIVVFWIEDGRVTSMGTIPRELSVGPPSRTSWVIVHKEWIYCDRCWEYYDHHCGDYHDRCDESHDSGRRGGWRPTPPGLDDSGNPRQCDRAYPGRSAPCLH